MARRAGRSRGQLPNCYYEGYLEKRASKDKASRKLWTCLCGNTLYFFNDKRNGDYIEKLDLSGRISVSNDSSQDRNLEAARFTVKTQSELIRFTAPNPEARELWKGFILAVSELCVPPSLNLLPGQFHMLQEAVQTEKERLKNVPPTEPISTPSYMNVDQDLPPCYHSVSRLEAELLLEKESKKGNLLLRPGSDGNSFSVTTRQDHDRAIFSHYRVTSNTEGFSIEVDNPVPCSTLREVIEYLVVKTDGALIPLILEEQYEKNIFYIHSDSENGERSVQAALPNISCPPVLPKPAFRVLIPEPAPAVFHFVRPRNTQAVEEAPGVPQTELRKTFVSKPPVAAPRKSLLSSSTSSISSSSHSLSSSPPSSSSSPPSSSSSLPSVREIRARSQTDPMGQTISELRLRFEQKASGRK